MKGNWNRSKLRNKKFCSIFMSRKKKKKKKEKAVIEKAKRGEDGMFLVIDYELGHDTCVLPARRYNEEEKKKYSDWYAESGFVGMGALTTLKQIGFSDMPNRKPDETFSGGSDSVWIISSDEFDWYICENEKREKAIREKEAEQKRQREEKKAQYEKEKVELVSQVPVCL